MLQLAGAVFEGHLQAPGLGKCGLSYRFSSTPLVSPMPAAVKSQRRQLGWSTNEQEISCFSAICSIPDLGLESEEVIISADEGSNESKQMLLQSLTRPDLGLTILLLDSKGLLIGGDETWTPGETPIIRAKRCVEVVVPRPPPGPASPVRRPGVPAVPSKAVRCEPDAEPDVEAETDTMAPPSPPKDDELLGFGVVGGSDLPDTEEVSVCMPLPTGDEATGRVLGEESTGRILPEDCPPRATYVGGIGRSAGAQMSKSKVLAGYKKSESMRPDEATGKPGAKLESVPGDPATAAADQERFVSAAVAGEVDDVQQLLGRMGVRIDGFVEEGRHAKLTALMAASARGRTDVVRLLLNRKAGIDVKDSQGWTALMHGIHGQRIDVCQVLLENNAEFQHAGGESPLILAASGARYELCKMLVEKKAALSVPDSEGCTALHHAARRGRGAAVATLLAARAKLEKQDAQGYTPLIAAAAAGPADTVQLLLAHGADAKAADVSGRGAKELAIAYQHDRVLKVLQNPRA